jgi:hypothetical protein
MDYEYPKEMRLAAPVSGVARIECWPKAKGGGRRWLILDLDREVKLRVEEEPNQSPEPTAMSVTPPAAQEPRQP